MPGQGRGCHSESGTGGCRSPGQRTRHPEELSLGRATRDLLLESSSADSSPDDRGGRARKDGCVSSRAFVRERGPKNPSIEAPLEGFFVACSTTKLLRVGRAANRPAPHRSGRADFPHPVPQQDGFAARAQPRRCTAGAGSGKRARNRVKRFQGIGAPRVRRDSHLCHTRVSL